MSDFTRRLAAMPDADLIAEMQAALDSLTPADLASLPTPGLTPFLGTPCGDDHPDEPTELELQEYEDDNDDWEYEDGPNDRD